MYLQDISSCLSVFLEKNLKIIVNVNKEVFKLGQNLVNLNLRARC